MAYFVDTRDRSVARPDRAGEAGMRAYLCRYRIVPWPLGGQPATWASGLFCFSGFICSERERYL